MRTTVDSTRGRVWTRAVRLVVGGHADASADPAVAVRDLFLRFLVVISVFTIPMLMSGEAPGGWRFAGGVALTGLVVAWLRGHRRQHFPAWQLTLEGAALCVLGIAVGDPPRALGVMYFALWFRSFYGSRRAAIGLGVAYIGAQLGAVAASNLLGFAPAATTVTSPGIVMQAPGMALTVVIIRVLVNVANRRNEATRRQHVLADVGTALAAATLPVDVAAAARDGATSMTGADGVIPTAVAFLEGQDLVVAAATDPDLVGETLPADTLDRGGHADGSREPDSVTILDGAAPLPWSATSIVTVMVDGAVGGAILVGTSEQDLLAALAPLASHVGLALARVQVAAEIQAREARFRSLLANANDIITVVDAQATIIYESDPVRHVLGYDPADLIGTNGFDLLHPDDAAELAPVFQALLTKPGSATPALEYRMRHADGSWRQIEGTGINLLDDPAVQGIVVNQRDITDRKSLEADLHHRALHDPLTELPNRALFHDRVEHASQAQGRTGRAIGVLFIDLDDFKVINDGLGHRAGDAVLVATARRLQLAARASDTCARLGGDEFGVLLEGLAGPDEAYAVSARILEALREPLEFEGATIDIDASVGIAVSVGTETADELIRNADLAMYRAKGSGKGHCEVFEAGMHAAVRDRLALKADLERGIANEEFVPFYQPIVDLSSEQPVGVEALVRWQHPELGLLPPAAFLGLAEETGLIVPIGRQIIRKACRDATTWPSPLALNINLSVPELQHPDLHDFLAAALGDNGLDPQRMIVEITESMLVADTEAASSTLEKLKAMGLRVALDDFGTGFSSLAFLHQFPVDVVKIDKTFIDSLGLPVNESPLAGAILNLGRSLGLCVSAEGVEGRTQLARLRELGCEKAQGYYFSRPLSAPDFAASLERQPAPLGV